MITAKGADKLVQLTKKQRRKAAQEFIRNLPHDDEVRLIMEHFEKEIKRICETGYRTLDINMDQTFGKEKSGVWPSSKKPFELLKELGFKIDMSCSSNTFNERAFIRW